MGDDRSEALELTRERVIQSLCHHYAHDRLTMPQLEQRLELAQKLDSDRDLESLLTGLAPVSALPSTLNSSPLVQRAVPGTVPLHERLLALMGESKRNGVWTAPAHLDAVAVMGEVKLDFTQAKLGDVTRIEANAIMGSVVILVPPGVRVESRGSGIMGSFVGRGLDDADLGPDAPVIRISGIACMGEVKVKLAVPKLKRLRG
jgi:hypothetical protein